MCATELANVERLPQQVEQEGHLPGLFLAALRSAGHLSRAAQQHLRSRVTPAQWLCRGMGRLQVKCGNLI